MNKQKTRKTKTERGITLVALIITIIILLILAVVAISAVTGDGIIAHAKKARDEQAKAQVNEGGLLDQYMSHLNTGENIEIVEDAVGAIDSNHTITLYSSLPDDTYILKYEDANGVMTNYANICSLGAGASYDDFIVQNTAPQSATKIGVYNSSGERVGSVGFTSTFKPNLGNKLYSFGAISDVHIGYETAESDFQNALTYFTQTEKVAFVGISGDLTADCTTEQLTTYQSIVDNYSGSTPVYAITGNHDTEQYRGSNISNSIDDYTGKPMYYSVTQGNDVFIFLGEYNGYDAGRVFIRGELQWLYETLEANRNKRCFIFEHIRPDSTSGNPHNLQAVDLWGGTEATIFESLLEHYPNITFFHGHSHTALALQSDSDIANYDSSLGCHSIHIPALFGTRELDSYGKLYNDIGSSEGYVVDVHETGIVVRGYDFIAGKFLPIALYGLDTRIKIVDADTYADETVTINCDTVIPTWTYGATLNSTTGLEETNADISITNSVSIISGKKYYAHQYYGCPYAGYAFYYDANGTLISRTKLWDGTNTYSGPVELTPPSGAKSFRISQWTRSDEEKHTRDVFITYKSKSNSSNSEVNYTNVLDTVGYTEQKRLSGSSGVEVDNTGTDVTGYIPVSTGDTIIYLKNVSMTSGGGYAAMIGLYYADKTYRGGFTIESTTSGIVSDENGNIVSIHLLYSDIAYVRIGAQNIDGNSIITVNEPIE